MSQEVFTVVLDMASLNNASRLGFRAPADAQGGGITVVGAEASIVGTANITLAKWSNAGTPAVNGTIGAAVGGTATANVPYEFTISTGFVDAGEWIVVQENNVGTPTRCDVIVRYKMGR